MVWELADPVAGGGSHRWGRGGGHGAESGDGESSLTETVTARSGWLVQQVVFSVGRVIYVKKKKRKW